MSKPKGQVCPFHADEWIKPEKCDSETAEYTFTCSRTKDHPTHGPYTWAYIAEPAGVVGDSLGLGLDIELPQAVTTAVTARQTLGRVRAHRIRLRPRQPGRLERTARQI